MRFYLLLTVNLLLTGTLFSAVAEDNKPDTKQQTPQTVAPADGSKPKAPAPAKSFTPSEKVGADSAVSFPVDI